MPVSGLYDTKTTRRAEEREMVPGESGGKRLWKAFITRERCGGAFGPGGGKDASTSLGSYKKRCKNLIDIHGICSPAEEIGTPAPHSSLASRC